MHNRVSYRFLLAALLMGMMSVCSLHAQVLVNKGAQIHIKQGALVTVNGNTENREGEIRVYDKATVNFNGSVSIMKGGLYLLQDCLAAISMDLSIGAAGVCWRYSPGVLNVLGTIRNDGELNNESEINIGKP